MHKSKCLVWLRINRNYRKTLLHSFVTIGHIFTINTFYLLFDDYLFMLFYATCSTELGSTVFHRSAAWAHGNKTNRMKLLNRLECVIVAIIQWQLFNRQFYNFILCWFFNECLTAISDCVYNVAAFKWFFFSLHNNKKARIKSAKMKHVAMMWITFW